MKIAWRYICLLRDPVSKRCLFWIRIPIIIWWDTIIFGPPRPDPPPWIAGEKIRPELARDLQVLATIDALAQTLSDERRKVAMDFVQKQFDAIELPEGMSMLSERDLQGNRAD